MIEAKSKRQIALDIGNSHQSVSASPFYTTVYLPLDRRRVRVYLPKNEVILDTKGEKIDHVELTL